MADAISVSSPISGSDKTLTFATGRLAPQSQGAVEVSVGDTTALVTANGAKDIREGIDFFPLTVDVEEKAYAAGKIPGSFFRREGRPSDQAVLVCRLIDRPLRPSFAEGYRNETQVVATIIGSDQENPYDVPAINGASAALMLSGLPFEGPIGAVRLAYSTDGAWIPHPTYLETEESTFQIVVAGRVVGDDVAIMMVEAGGTEKAWTYYEAGAPKVTEEVIAGGLEACKQWIRESIDLQLELVAKAGVHEPVSWVPQNDYAPEIAARVAEIAEARLAEANTIAEKIQSVRKRSSSDLAPWVGGPRRRVARDGRVADGDLPGGGVRRAWARTQRARAGRRLARGARRGRSVRDRAASARPVCRDRPVARRAAGAQRRGATPRPGARRRPRRRQPSWGGRPGCRGCRGRRARGRAEALAGAVRHARRSRLILQHAWRRTHGRGVDRRPRAA